MPQETRDVYGERRSWPSKWAPWLPLVQDLAGGETTEAEVLPVLREVANTFRLRMTMLSTLLQSNKLQSANRAPAVRQLLLRLNYNGFNAQGTLSAALRPF